MPQASLHAAIAWWVKVEFAPVWGRLYQRKESIGDRKNPGKGTSISSNLYVAVSCKLGDTHTDCVPSISLLFFCISIVHIHITVLSYWVYIIRLVWAFEIHTLGRGCACFVSGHLQIAPGSFLALDPSAPLTDAGREAGPFGRKQGGNCHILGTSLFGLFCYDDLKVDVVLKHTWFHHFGPDMFLRLRPLPPWRIFGRIVRTSLQGDPSHGLYAIRIIYLMLQYGLQMFATSYDWLWFCTNCMIIILTSIIMICIGFLLVVHMFTLLNSWVLHLALQVWGLRIYNYVKGSVSSAPQRCPTANEWWTGTEIQDENGWKTNSVWESCKALWGRCEDLFSLKVLEIWVIIPDGTYAPKTSKNASRHCQVYWNVILTLSFTRWVRSFTCK